MSTNQKSFLLRDMPLFAALPLTFLGIGLVLLPQFGFTFPTTPVSLAVIGSTQEAVNAVRAEMDVQSRTEHQGCRIWSGYLNGKMVALGLAEPEDTEGCATWLLDHYPPQALLVLEPTSKETQRINAIANARQIPVLNAADNGVATVKNLLQQMAERSMVATSARNP